ncbi:MAG: hypothetical protein ACI9XO_004385 [Paraglaciecola sp.]|jgi:hypothetical protein
MYIFRTSLLLALLFVASINFAQTSSNNTFTSINADANDLLATRYIPKKSTRITKRTYRFHQRLSGTHSGLAIELIASNLPLERTLPLFRQFGNVHYDKLAEGGYSYVIKTDITDKKSLKKFYETIILPRNVNAKMVEYKFGKRNIL